MCYLCKDNLPYDTDPSDFIFDWCYHPNDKKDKLINMSYYCRTINDHYNINSSEVFFMDVIIQSNEKGKLFVKFITLAKCILRT